MKFWCREHLQRNDKRNLLQNQTQQRYRNIHVRSLDLSRLQNRSPQFDEIDLRHYSHVKRNRDP